MTAVFADITLRLFLLSFFSVLFLLFFLLFFSAFNSTFCSFNHIHTYYNCQWVSFICFCRSRITIPSVPSPYSCPGDRIRNFSYLQIIFCAIFVTAFVIFPICRLSLLYTCDRISSYPSFADYLLRHICDHIRTFFHLQIISCAILVTAFALFPICRLSSTLYL